MIRIKNLTQNDWDDLFEEQDFHNKRENIKKLIIKLMEEDNFKISLD